MRFRFALMMSLGAATTVGCVNARDGFDEFGNRIIDAAPTSDGMIVSSLPDITGDFYTVARAPTGAELKLVHFRSTVVFRPITENTGEMDWTGQPLDFETREPVGDVLMTTDAPVNSDATVDFEAEGIIPGRANSVTPDQPALMDAVLHAQIRSADFQCGTLTGTAGTLNLAGATFAQQRITGDTLPDPVWECPPE